MNDHATEQEGSLVSHLAELRNRLLRAIGSIFVVFLGLVYFANDIYEFVAAPLIQTMPEGATMIATEVASPFIAPFKLTFVVSIFLAIPFVLYQVWGFIAPALFKHERRLIIPLLLSSTILFYGGIAFAFFVVFPLVFGFLSSIGPEGVQISTDIGSYLDFVLKLFLAFGLSFEIPVAILLMCWSGVTTRESLVEKRPYVIVGAFVLGMLLTPPDVISQVLLAIPMWALFEVGLIFSVFYQTREDTHSEDELEQ